MGLFVFLADIISTVEFNYSGELLATGDKGGRVVIFQHEQEVRLFLAVFFLKFYVTWPHITLFPLVSFICPQSKNRPHLRGEYNVYSTFQSHEPEFDYLKSLEIEEKINKIRWLPQQNAAHFLLSTNGKPDTLTLVSYGSLIIRLLFTFDCNVVVVCRCQIKLSNCGK